MKSQKATKEQEVYQGSKMKKYKKGKLLNKHFYYLDTLEKNPDNIQFIADYLDEDADWVLKKLDDRNNFVKKARTKKDIMKKDIKYKKPRNDYLKVENWVQKNAKKYSTPESFEKALRKRFGNKNQFIVDMGSNKTRVTSYFSADFKRMMFNAGPETQIVPSHLKQFVKSSLYNFNPKIKAKVTEELKGIFNAENLPKLRTEARKMIRNNKTLAMFGMDKGITGPFPKVIQAEIGKELWTDLKNFRHPRVGTAEMLRAFSDLVPPEFKPMFQETIKAINYSKNNQWQKAKDTFGLADDIMWDHKVPSSVIDKGYADTIEYLKVNPTSKNFNERIKNAGFDQKINRLITKYENADSLINKEKVYNEMLGVKKNFSSKYGNYLDEVNITFDKTTGNLRFSSTATPLTTKMDRVKMLEKSLQQERKGITSPPKNIKGAISMELLDDMFKAGKITVGTAGGIMQAARKMGAEFEIAFILGEYFNNVGKGQETDLAWANAKQSATMGFWKGGDRKYLEKLKELAKEEGIDSSTFEKVYEINKREHLATTMGMTGKLSPVAQIKTLEDQLKELKSIPKIFQDKKIIAAKENLLNIKKGQLEKYKKETWDKESELIFDIRKNKAGYRNNIRPNLDKIADTPVYEDEYSDAFKNLGNIAVKYLDIEKKKAYAPKKPWVPKKIKRALNIPAGQSEQLHSDMGPWGNLLSTNIFNMDVFTKQLPEMGKYAWDVINPTTPLPKLRTDFRTEAQKEQHRILEMAKKNKRELYLYNLARDNVPGVSLESFLDLATTKPGLGIRTGEASGGRAGYMGGGIAGIRKPNAIPPERGGLRSIMINGKKY